MTTFSVLYQRPLAALGQFRWSQLSHQISCQLSRQIARFSRPASLGIIVGTGGLVGSLILGIMAQAISPTPAIAQSHQAEAPLLGDGVYFYGQAPTPDQLGVGYMVFEAQGERVIGAIYMPFSSFDCFQGRVAGGNFALQITNSYTQETYGYDIALGETVPVASQSGGIASFGLEGFHNLGAPGTAELQLLQTCQGALTSSSSLDI